MADSRGLMSRGQLAGMKLDLERWLLLKKDKTAVHPECGPPKT